MRVWGRFHPRNHEQLLVSERACSGTTLEERPSLNGLWCPGSLAHPSPAHSGHGRGLLGSAWNLLRWRPSQSAVA